MTTFIGEIRPTAFPHAPAGWHVCDGTQLSVSAYSALFSVIGTAYGGNGSTHFALPDLRERVPMGATDPSGIGGAIGSNDVTLSEEQVSLHNHNILAQTGEGSRPEAQGNMLASATLHPLYGEPGGSTSAALETAPAGEGVPHENQQPFQMVYYMIALEGQYPSRP